jgi:hypothetical protein
MLVGSGNIEPRKLNSFGHVYPDSYQFIVVNKIDSHVSNGVK